MSYTPGPWHGRHNGDDPIDGILIEDATQVWDGEQRVDRTAVLLALATDGSWTR